MLSRKPVCSEQLQNITDKIIKNMDRADGMIRDLLDANRLKAGEKLELNMQECDLNKITLEVLEDLKNIHGDRFLFKADKQIKGFWDVQAIRRILENLLSNAIKYGSPSSDVTIMLCSLDKIVRINVHNSGNIIQEKDQKAIFEVFHRSDSALIGTKEGWGIGLSLIKGLSIAHGGDVSVKSSIADGTLFSVTLLADARVF